MEPMSKARIRMILNRPENQAAIAQERARRAAERSAWTAVDHARHLEGQITDLDRMIDWGYSADGRRLRPSEIAAMKRERARLGRELRRLA